MGAAVEKQFLYLNGIPIIAHTLKVFDDSPEIDGVVLVVAARHHEVMKQEVLDSHPCKKLLQIVDGGLERQDSVARGLEAVPPECEIVVVHDGVRPLVGIDLLGSVVKAAHHHGAAIAAIPARDTVKRVERGLVTGTLEREKIWLAQTPQAFHTSLLRQAYDKAISDKTTVTDDAALVERMGAEVHLVLGSNENIKVTTPTDLVVAEAILAHREGRR